MAALENQLRAAGYGVGEYAAILEILENQSEASEFLEQLLRRLEAAERDRELLRALLSEHRQHAAEAGDDVNQTGTGLVQVVGLEAEYRHHIHSEAKHDHN